MTDNVDVVVVGAGLAGLVAAIDLTRAGRSVALLEASDGPGGRVRTDVVDGVLLDRGFQLLCPGYPEAVRRLDLDALRLGSFRRGALVWLDGRLRRLEDPRLGPAAVARTLRAGVLGPRDLAGLAAMSVRDWLAPDAVVTRGRDVPARRELARFGITTATVDRVLQPFLRGVLADADLDTSGRFVHLVWRSFARGAPAVPAAGMGAIAAQLATRLPDGVLRLSTRVAEVTTTGVRLAGDSGSGEVRAPVVVVATDADTARELVPAARPPDTAGLTTYHHVTTRSPLDEPLLVLDGEDGLVANTAVMTTAAPTYAPPGTALVSSTVLGVPTSVADTERAVRARLATLYGVPTRDWELAGTYAIPHALPRMPAPHPLRRPVRLGDGRYVCGDHRDTSSIQGALVSGRRAAAAVLADRP